MSGSGGVLVHVFTAFRHLLLRNRDSIWDLLLGSGIVLFISKADILTYPCFA